MTLIDDFSRYVVIYLMKTRDEVLRHFKTTRRGLRRPLANGSPPSALTAGESTPLVCSLPPSGDREFRGRSHLLTHLSTTVWLNA